MEGIKLLNEPNLNISSSICLVKSNLFRNEQVKELFLKKEREQRTTVLQKEHVGLIKWTTVLLRFKDEFFNKQVMNKCSVLSLEISCGLPSESPSCVFCNQKFFNKSSLRRHMERHLLTNRKRFQCDVCFKLFCRKDYVREHKQHMHGLTKSSIETSQSETL